MKSRPFPVIILVLVVSFSRPPLAIARVDDITDDLRVTHDRTFPGGVYHFRTGKDAGIIRVEADNVVLDGGGLELRGPGVPEAEGHMKARGMGIYIGQHRNVTIKNFKIHGFRWGIYATDVKNLTILDCDLADNHEDTRQMGSRSRVGLEGWMQPAALLPVNAEKGGGLALRNVDTGVFKRLQLQRNAIGLAAYDSHNLIIADSNASDCTAWGMLLYHSSYNVLRNNTINNVWRFNSGGRLTQPTTWNNSGDAAGLLFVINSNHNAIVGNHMHDGVEGYFGGGRESYTLADDYTFAAFNDVENNWANCMEHTFGQYDVFYKNTVRRCAAGAIYLGVSRDAQVIRNTISDSIPGMQQVAIDHENGVRCLYFANTIQNVAGDGIHLMHKAKNGWWPSSADNTILRNRIETTGIGIHLDDNDRASIRQNTLLNNGQGIVFEHDSNTQTAAENILQVAGPIPNLGNRSFAPGTRMVNLMPADHSVDARNNFWGASTAAGIQNVVFDKLQNGQYGPILWQPFLTTAPDLTPAATDVRVTRLILEPIPRDHMAPQPGDELTFIANVANMGSIATGPFVYHWYWDDELLMAGATPGLAPGASFMVRWSWRWADDPSTAEHRVRFLADADADLADPDRSNNSAELRLVFGNRGGTQ